MLALGIYPFRFVSLVFCLSSTHNSYIEPLVSRDPVGSTSWNLGFHRNLNDLEFNKFVSLVSLIENFVLQVDGVDYKVWLKESPGCFSCHSFFNFI